MEKCKLNVSIARVTDGVANTGKSFSVVEGLSGDIGLFKLFVPPELGAKARDCMEYAHNTVMILEPYTDREYRVSCRVSDFEIE